MSVHRNIRLLAWFNFWTDFRPYAPIAILYFAQVSGSYALGMSVYSVAHIAQFLFEVPTGIFSDLIGRKRTMICGACAAVLSLVFYAIGGTYLALVVGGVFEGLARAFYSGNNEAFLHDTLAETGQQAKFQEYLGKTSSMFQAALGISALLGGLLAAASFTLVLWVSVVPQLLALLLSLRFVNPQVAHSHEGTNPFAHLRAAFINTIRNPRLRTLSIASVMSFSIGESSWLMRSAFVASLWPVWALGVAQMLSNAFASIGFYFAGRFIKRFGEIRLLGTGYIFSQALQLFALITSTVLSPLLMSLDAIFFGINTVAIGGLLQREFTDEQRATMGSLNSFAGSIAFAIFSFFLGGLADRFGVIAALVFASLLSIIPLFLYWRTLRTPGRAEQPVVEAEVGSA
jgi:MFS family permease